MSIATLFKYLLGSRAAISEIARTRRALYLGALFVLSAGLAVNVGIRTGSRRVIEYVLSPLMRHQKEALHER